MNSLHVFVLFQFSIQFCLVLVNEFEFGSLTTSFVFVNRKTLVNFYTKFVDCSFTCSNDMIAASKIYKSPLLLTDLRDTVPQAHRVVHRCRRSV